MYRADMTQRGTTTDEALLGLLSIRPMSGYDMRLLIPHSIGHFWNESYGQIYPALKRMSKAGLVAKKTGGGRTSGAADGPVRHEYSLTEAGRKHMEAWLKAPVSARGAVRDELLLKLFFGAEMPPQLSQAHVEAALETAEGKLKVYRETERKLNKASRGNPQLPFWLMTLSLGKHDARAKIAWCRETLKELRGMRGRMDGRTDGQREDPNAGRDETAIRAPDAGQMLVRLQSRK